MKRFVLSFALAVGLLASASTMQAQVNMSRYITLTVAKDSAIWLNFKAAAEGTPVRIVSGSNTQDITVGTDWKGRDTYTAGSTTMTIYGNIIDFGCSQNGANLTALDVSHNTQLTGLWCWDNNLSNLDVSQNTQLGWLFCSENRLSSLDVSGCTQLAGLDCCINNLSNLDVSHNTQLTELSCRNNNLSSLDISHNTQLAELYCHGNKFTTAALDDIYCALPDRGGKSPGKIQPVYDSSSSYNDTVLATNKANAIAKNWKVQYWQDYTDIPATTGTYVCGTVHLDTYITLTVAKGFAIKLNFRAAAAGTPIRIVSGSITRNITVGTGWYDGHYPSNFIVNSDDTEMTVYGDIIGFNCAGNGANITELDLSHNTQLTTLDCSSNTLSSLDVSKNTQLTTLYCYGNKFTTATLDDIYCALPDRTGKGNGVIQPVFNSSDPNHATILATNAANATTKNWKVQYYDDDTDITTTGTYVCGTVHLDTYITLTVKNGAAIYLDFKAANEGTPVRIVSGSNTQDITVGTSWKGRASYTADGTEMKVYGDITDFSCSGNGANLTAIDPSHNTQLEILYCSSNQLTSLDVSNNTQLTMLSCGNNKLSSLDVSNNTQLTMLNCYDNSLNSLDISHNTQLTQLYCYDNSLNSLDISHNTQLKGLYCYDNNFTTATLDDIYCALPDRTSETNGVIYPIYNSSSSNHATVIATNAQNATAKNWKVQYRNNDTDIPATTGTYVCGTPHPEPNMNSYITLTVKKDSAIKLDFRAAADGTPIRIVSGSNTQDITVGTVWEGTTYYTADGTEMKVYGDIIGFDCQGNGANLTAIDVSHNTLLEVLLCQGNQLSILDVSKNTQLTELYCYRNQLSSLDISKNTQLGWLYCYGNNFSTAALDDIYCTLPDRTGTTNGKIQPVYSDTSSNHATVLATNKQNAIAKNWKVQYGNYTDIPATTGTYVCGTPHLDTYITLTVKSGKVIRLDFEAAADGTPVRIESGSNTQDITVGTDWKGATYYTADGTKMKIYGNIIGFDCNDNEDNITALDVSKNTQLTKLYCNKNNLSSLDVSKNTQLTWLYCNKNNLSSLDVSKNTQLTWLYCNKNNLSHLDISKNTALTVLSLWGNKFSTATLDAIYCRIPDMTGQPRKGYILPIHETSSATEQNNVNATNANNATDKNWRVVIYKNDDTIDDITTTGTYDCSTSVVEATAEQALTLYPNPVSDVLYLSATARSIRVYDIYGIEVAHATDTDRVEVSHLPAGIYTVKADGTVAKMVKR